MTDFSTRAGGRIIAGGSYVAVDDETVHGSGVPDNPLTASVFTDGTSITGNGTQDDPLAATGSPSPPAPQRLVAAGAISPTNPLTFATANASGTSESFTLADGTVDGFQKTVAFNPTSRGSVIDPANYYHLFATFAQGYDHLHFPAVGGGVVLVWDDANSWWSLVATFGGVADA